mmetsp:Transcript_14453/g.27080  ORF Transcript_14453/g.27080 Transcript_14453/m.27080 type:complete len:391 (-) Transcript_14453:91-1263(-)
MADVRRAGDHVAAPDLVALVLDILLHGSHQQEERRMHPQDLADGCAELRHLLVAFEGEGRRVAPQDLLLLRQQLLDELRARKDFERRPGGRDGTVVHTAKEGGDQKSDDLLVGDGSPIRVRRVQDRLHEVFRTRLSLVASQLQNWLHHFVQPPPSMVPLTVPLDRRVGPKDRHGKHAFLQNVQELYDGGLVGVLLHHPLSQLVAHEAANARPGQQLLHGFPDVNSAGLAPAFIKELDDLLLQGACVRADVVVRQPLPDEAQLARPCGVVHVIEDLGTEDGNCELVHVGLVQVLIHGEEPFLALGPDEVDHVDGHEIHLENSAHLLVAQPHELHGILQELDDGTHQRQAHGEGRWLLPRSPPSSYQQCRHDHSCPGRHQRSNGPIGCLVAT